MANSPGLRDQRLEIYARVEAGTDGFTRPTYVYQGTLWGRLDAARELQAVATAPQQHTEYRGRFKATFSYTAVVPENGLILYGGEIYFIRSIIKRRQLWRTDVDCEYVDVNRYAEFELFEGKSVTDGVHLLDDGLIDPGPQISASIGLAQAGKALAAAGNLRHQSLDAMLNAQALASAGLGCYWKYSGSLGSRSDLNAFTRASTALQLGANGIWTSVANNVLRDAHYLLDGIQRTLLERATTNSALWSSDQSNAVWAKAGGTIVSALSCISGQTAQKFTNGGGGNANINQLIGTFVNGQTDIVWFMVENTNALVSSVAVHDSTASADVCRVNYTWATNTTALGAGAGVFGSILLDASGPSGGALVLIWVAATGTASGTGAAGHARFANVYPTGVGVNTLSAIVHHGQCELTFANPTSPVVTGAATVSRAADGTLNFPFAPTAAQCAAQGVTIYDDLIVGRASLQTFQSCSTVLGGAQIGATNIFELWNGSLGEAVPVSAQMRGPAGTTSESDATALAFVPGDRLQRMVTITPAGAVTITVLKNGVASSTTGTGLNGGWPAAFVSAIFTLNDTNANRSGDMSRSVATIALGVQSLATMEAL